MKLLWFSAHDTRPALSLWFAAVILLLAPALVTAQESPPSPLAGNLHPLLALLDAQGVNVLESGAPVSPVRSCGYCHDTAYITAHSYHAWVCSDASAPENDATVLLSRDPDSRPAPTAGSSEMNCFLCHIEAPAFAARMQSKQSELFPWATTATLAGTGLIRQRDTGWTYDREFFDTNGAVDPDRLGLQSPRAENCGYCHGQVVSGEAPVTLQMGPGTWRTHVTGQIFSAQPISRSGVNLQGRSGLYRAWDIHAERLLTCTRCHYSLNNPALYREAMATRPGHQQAEARRLSIQEYLRQPNHNFAKGRSAQSRAAPYLDDTMRRCEHCHNFDAAHDWLPFKHQHRQRLLCEACHVPHVYAPAQRVSDWTVLTTDGGPRVEYRGSEEPVGISSTLVTGYRPVLLPRKEADGRFRLGPYNLIASWFWVSGDSGKRVSGSVLRELFLDGDDHHPDIVAAWDADGDGVLTAQELRLDTPAKEAVIRERLVQAGIENPRIAAELQPYGIHHHVAGIGWATRDCDACHGESSLTTDPFVLADFAPGDVTPEIAAGNYVRLAGEFERESDGTLRYRPRSSRAGLYLLGHDRSALFDLIGLLVVGGVLLGTGAHCLQRGRMRRQRQLQQSAPPPVRREYMYGIYERIWHWLQAAVGLLLLFTGLAIHWPGLFGIDFAGAIAWHNVLAFVLLVNAALALFFHLTTGEIKQFVPAPNNLFTRLARQYRYYVWGMFRGAPHPIAKNRRSKFNPMQQLAYLGLLNLLLPLQVLSGLLLWGGQRWPGLLDAVGGLALPAALHSLGAWLFGAFLLLHVYLTTTGHRPSALIVAMITGWEEMAEHDGASHGRNASSRKGT
ncbi:MAG: cytochrome b/b6 domain-containing protein [bacterium]